MYICLQVKIQAFKQKLSKGNEKCECVFLLDHEGDVLIQVAGVEFDQVHEDMQEIWWQTEVHPQQNKPSWERTHTNTYYNLHMMLATQTIYT